MLAALGDSRSAHAQFNLTSFPNATGLNLVGNAALSGASNRLRITPASGDQLGAAWYSTPQVVAQGFTTTFQFQGYSNPRDLFSIQNGFDAFQRKVRLTFLLDYKGGFSLFNNTTEFYCQQTNFCYDVNSKSASLADQARNVAQRACRIRF